MSFDFMLQGNGNQDSFQAALDGTNILSLETSLIQTNVLLNSGMINVSPYAGQQVDAFPGHCRRHFHERGAHGEQFPILRRLATVVANPIGGDKCGADLAVVGSRLCFAVRQQARAAGFVDDGYECAGHREFSIHRHQPDFQRQPLLSSGDHRGTGFAGAGFREQLHSLVAVPAAANYVLETTANLTATNSWTTVTDTPAIVNLQCLVTNQISGAARFYRLRKQ